MKYGPPSSDNELFNRPKVHIMKTKLIKHFSLIVAFIMIFPFSGCVAVNKLIAPENFKEGYQVSGEYPKDIIPVYDDSIIFKYEEDEESFLLEIGSVDELNDVTGFYMDFFEDEGITLTTEKDRKNEYIAEGGKDKYEFELNAQKPTGKWEEKLYNSVIVIDINIVNIADKEELKNYISMVIKDFDTITQILQDEESFGEITDSELIETIITDILDAIEGIISEVNLRMVPNHDEFVKFHDAQYALLNLTNEVFQEYDQVMKYANALIDLGEQLDNMTDSDDINVIYNEMYNVMDNAVIFLEGLDVPTFLKTMNDSFIEIFKQFNKMIEYNIIASDLLDPIRMDAGEYAMDIIIRELDKITVAAEQDMLDREVKFEEDISSIKDTKDGLIKWLDDASLAIDADADAINHLPEELSIGSLETKISCSYSTPEFIIPANYRSLDSIVFLQCWTNQGTTDALVTVEIPGFTQKYQQKVELSRAETELNIHPPLVEDAAKNLNSSKDAQIIITVEDLNTGELIVQDSKNIKLYSRFDMQWWDEDGTPYIENILAWVTPEAPEVNQLLNFSADSANYLSEGVLDSIVGYQYVSDWSETWITYMQVVSMMHAMASTMDVKYINASFSTAGTGLQRVATPAEVLNNAGGLCCETAVTIASAIQSTGMHPVLILLPGHMQTAVETWYGSGEYLLIETTALTDAANENFDNVVSYLTTDEWFDYLAQDGVTVIDCDFSEQFGIHAID